MFCHCARNLTVYHHFFRFFFVSSLRNVSRQKIKKVRIQNRLIPFMWNFAYRTKHTSSLACNVAQAWTKGEEKNANSHAHKNNPTPKSIYIHLFSGIVESNLICKLNCLRLKWSSLALQQRRRLASRERKNAHNISIINVTSNKIFLIIHCNCTSAEYIGLRVYDWAWLIRRLLCILFYFIFFFHSKGPEIECVPWIFTPTTPNAH